LLHLYTQQGWYLRDYDDYVGRAYGSLILKANSIELDLRSQDFYTDGSAIYIPSTKVVKKMGELVSLGSLCNKKDCIMKNGFIYLGSTTQEMVENLKKIVKS